MGEVADACGIQFRLLNTSRGPAASGRRARSATRPSTASRCARSWSASRISSSSKPGGGTLSYQRVSESAGSAVNGSSRSPCDRRPPARWPHHSRRRSRGHHWNIPQWHHPLWRSSSTPRGASGEPASVLLGEALKRLGLRECRLKTGTPRLDGRTIDWSKFVEQPGDADPRRSVLEQGSGIREQGTARGFRRCGK